MGTWDTGPFDNHTACDVLAAIADGNFDFDAFKLMCPSQTLALEDAETVIALGALAKLPAERLPAGISSARVELLHRPEYRAWLRKQITLATEPEHSTAYALWEATGELDGWLRTARAALP